MSKSLQTRTHQYPSLGKCIFCLGSPPESELTDEHIIPFALNGNLVFVDGTCKKCAEYGNKTFEQPALNADLYLPRVLLQLRRRNKKTQKTLPTVALGDDTLGCGGPKVQLDINTFPKQLALVVFDPAGLISNVERSSDLSSLGVCFFNLWFHDPTPIPGGVTVESKATNGPFATALAKSAYCFAVAELGLDAFDGDDIRDLLTGKRQDVYNFVGAPAAKEKLSDNHLHELYIRRQGPWVTVLVHLFCFVRDGSVRGRRREGTPGRVARRARLNVHSRSPGLTRSFTQPGTARTTMISRYPARVAPPRFEPPTRVGAGGLARRASAAHPLQKKTVQLHSTHVDSRLAAESRIRIASTPRFRALVRKAACRLRLLPVADA